MVQKINSEQINLYQTIEKTGSNVYIDVIGNTEYNCKDILSYLKINNLSKFIVNGDLDISSNEISGFTRSYSGGAYIMLNTYEVTNNFKIEIPFNSGNDIDTYQPIIALNYMYYQYFGIGIFNNHLVYFTDIDSREIVDYLCEIQQSTNYIVQLNLNKVSNNQITIEVKIISNNGDVLYTNEFNSDYSEAGFFSLGVYSHMSNNYSFYGSVYKELNGYKLTIGSVFDLPVVYPSDETYVHFFTGDSTTFIYPSELKWQGLIPNSLDDNSEYELSIKYGIGVLAKVVSHE